MYLRAALLTRCVLLLLRTVRNFFAPDFIEITRCVQTSLRTLPVAIVEVH